MFVNRTEELARLEDWWQRPRGQLGLVWGRRRVGKTALLEEFVRHRRERVVFHTAGGRPPQAELRILSRLAAQVLPPGARDLLKRPFSDWDDAFETLTEAARTESILLVLDEFPELTDTSPELPATMRAVWDRVGGRTKLRVLLCGSAVRVMQAMVEERAPLYGRLDLVLQVHPFTPHESAAMLPRLKPPDRALVWGLVGGVPLYLSWWDQDRSIRANLADLVCTPGGLLLTEGELLLATEAERGDLPRLVLHAIAAGRTKHHEISEAVRAEPSRTLDRLIELRIVERMVPVTEDAARSRRRIYRLSDNFLAFWLGVVDRFRPEIERGLGSTILRPLLSELDDFLGGRWEEAFRAHLRRLATEGAFGNDVVAIGPWWRNGQDEIDAVVLAGRRREAVLVGESKWTRSMDGARAAAALERKGEALPRRRRPLRLALCARQEVRGAPAGTLTVTADDIFAA